MDVRLKQMSSMLVIGPSMCGKTTFVEKLIKYRHVMYDNPPRRILWFTGSQYAAPNSDYTVYEGLPDNFDIIQPHDLIVLDDLMFEMQGSKEVSNLFTRMVHHTPCTVICISQNLFPNGKEARTRALNTQYMILFKNPRDARQIDVLSRQMYPNKAKYLTQVYHDATSSQKYGYVFIDLHQETAEELRVRTQILPDEAPQIVYVSSK